MQQFAVFDPDKAGTLSFTRNGWFRPSYMLTDGVNTYGELSFPGAFRRTGEIQSATKNWTIEFGSIFSRETLIKDNAAGEIIATLKTTIMGGETSLTFNDGQIFILIREGLFTGKLLWQSLGYGNLISVKSNLFSFKQPFTITPEHSTFKNNDYLLLMALTAVYLVLIRRARAAAH